MNRFACKLHGYIVYYNYLFVCLIISFFCIFVFSVFFFFFKLESFFFVPAISAPIRFKVANTAVKNLRTSNAVRFGENGVMNAQIKYNTYPIIPVGLRPYLKTFIRKSCAISDHMKL